MTAFIYKAEELNMSIDIDIKVGKMRIHHMMGSRRSTRIITSELKSDEKSLYEHNINKVGFSKSEMSSKNIAEKDIIYLIHQAKFLAELLDEVFTMEVIIFTQIDSVLGNILADMYNFKEQLKINIVGDFMQLEVYEDIHSELLNMLSKDELNSEYDIVDIRRLKSTIGLQLDNIKTISDTPRMDILSNKVDEFINAKLALTDSSYLMVYNGSITTADERLKDNFDELPIVLVGKNQSALDECFTGLLYGGFTKTLNACKNVSIPLAILAGNRYWYNTIRF